MKKSVTQFIAKRLFNAFTLPILYFGLAIILGAVVLKAPFSLAQDSISWTQAIFTSTSAVCVTGLSLVDVSSTFSQTGKVIIMLLMELGGIGLMTYTSILFLTWQKRMSLESYFMMKDSLSSDNQMHVGHFLLRIMLIVLAVEATGAVLLYTFGDSGFDLFSSIFHSISAFTNGGFSLFSNSLENYRANWPINLTIITLITAGSIGFAVLSQLVDPHTWKSKKIRLSWYAKMVLKTHFVLLFLGAILLFFNNYHNWSQFMSSDEVFLTALFQSATCRTAGFNTVDYSTLTMGAYLVMIILMFIGGSPGSCAGGVKTTTLRVLLAYAIAQIKGQEQVVVGNRAVDKGTLSNAVTLMIFSTTLIGISIYLLALDETVFKAMEAGGRQFLDLAFDVISAFGTVGVSVGMVNKLDTNHHWIFIALMFVGRLGPILFLSALRQWHRKKHYTWTEESVMIG